MEVWLQLLKLVRALLRFGLAYLIFFYGTHFTEAQSLVLAIVGVFAIDGYKLAVKTAERAGPEFEPFWVSISPKWYSICHDFDLAVGEKWERLRDSGKSNPAAYSVFWDGLNFTMLSPKLFYSNDHHTFFAELDLHLLVEELKPGQSEFFAPQFYIKRIVVQGKEPIPAFELGVVTENPLRNILNPTDAKSDIPSAAARLPEIVFYPYFHPEYIDSSKLKKLEERTDTLLADFGWSKEERDIEDSVFRSTSQIEHKYFTVSYRGLS